MANTLATYNPFYKQDGTFDYNYQDNGNLKDGVIRELRQKFGSANRYDRGSIVDFNTGKILGQRGSYAPDWYLNPAAAAHTGGNTAGSALTTGQTASSANPGYKSINDLKAATAPATAALGTGRWYSKDGIDYGYDGKPMNQPAAGATNSPTPYRVLVDPEEDISDWFSMVKEYEDKPAPVPSFPSTSGGTTFSTITPPNVGNLPRGQMGNTPGIDPKLHVVKDLNNLTAADLLAIKAGVSSVPDQEKIAEALHKMDQLGIKPPTGAAGTVSIGKILEVAGAVPGPIKSAAVGAAVAAGSDYVMDNGSVVGNALSGGNGTGGTGTGSTGTNGPTSLNELEKINLEILKNQLQRDKDNQALIASLTTDIKGRANPWDPEGADYRSLLTMRQSNVTRDFNNADRAARAALAARGMMGSGYEAAGTANIASGRAMGMSQTENDLRTRFFEGKQNFEDTRTRSLLNLASAGRDPSALATSLLNMQNAQNQFNLGRQDKADSERNAFIAGLAKWAAENPDALDDMGGWLADLVKGGT